MNLWQWLAQLGTVWGKSWCLFMHGPGKGHPVFAQRFYHRCEKCHRLWRQ